MKVNPDALRAIRERSGLRQVDLARQTGLPKETINRLEAGTRSGTPGQIASIAKALDVPVTAITGTALAS